MELKELFFRLKNGNDVRGAAAAAGSEAKTLSPGIAVFIAASFAEWLAGVSGKSAEELRIGVGHDSRVTAEALKEAVLRGLSGSKTYDCGLITTPAMFQSTVLPDCEFDGSVMITASHLPWNRNGMKFFTKDGGLGSKDLEGILERAAALAAEYGDEDADGLVSADRFPAAGRDAETFDLKSAYAGAMKNYVKESVRSEDYEHPLKGLHIIVDSGNGASGFFATDILEALGADVSGSVYLEPDGTFPNHVPNPENAEAMEAVRAATLKAGADLGVIFDCDGDRGAVVFPDGTEVNRNALIALLSAIVSEDYPGSTVVTDSVTSDELQAFIEGHLGMKHLRFKRGYKNVINKGIELNEAGEVCELAIETSGHGAFRGNYFSDDGAYIAIRIICKMAQLRKTGGRIESLTADLKNPAESKEYRFRITESDFKSYGTQVLSDFAEFAAGDGRFRVVEPNYEGIRISFDDPEVKGWMLLRMSLHDPVMPMNVETQEEGGCEKVMERLKPFLAAHTSLELA